MALISPPFEAFVLPNSIISFLRTARPLQSQSDEEERKYHFIHPLYALQTTFLKNPYQIPSWYTMRCFSQTTFGIRDESKMFFLAFWSCSCLHLNVAPRIYVMIIEVAVFFCSCYTWRNVFLEKKTHHFLTAIGSEVSFNMAENFSKVDAMHPYAAYGSVCKTEKWQNYTKVSETVGNGETKPGRWGRRVGCSHQRDEKSQDGWSLRVELSCREVTKNIKKH